MDNGLATWLAEIEPIEIEMATTAQRRALYRLGYSRYFAHHITKSGASDAIKSGIKMHSQMILKTVSSKSTTANAVPEP